MVSFRDDTFANPAGLVAFLGKQMNTAKLRPDHKLVFMRQWEETESRLRGVNRPDQGPGGNRRRCRLKTLRLSREFSP